MVAGMSRESAFHSAIVPRPVSKPIAAWLWPAAVVLAVASGLLLFDAEWKILAAALAAHTLLSVWVAGLRRRHAAPFGPASQVTLVRAGLVAVLAVALMQPEWFRAHAWLMAALALSVLILDGVDGWLARRRAETSTFGARFDMEVDAALIAVLCLALAITGKAGFWVLAIGLMRYAFVGAAWFWPWLDAPLPPSFRRKLVCVWQVAALLVCLTPLVGAATTTPILGSALVLLAASFAIDVAWLQRRAADSQSQKEMS